jgi:iron uptake system component EfeO
MRSLLPAAIGLLLVGTACSSDSKGAVQLTATDSACRPETTTFDAGTVTFDVKNDGNKVTEVYVYSDGDHIEGEVENIGPGTTKKLTVDLEAGKYQLACKPGQTGKGIRVPITVKGV